ncbi:hypothetical protein TIFTF001_014888 [Ficus carica]|uniref:Homeobox-leucine zipper protein n=1 Tax=Ficus carica TaxID=3494 RepID=A0AA88D8G8_FICCA|nr:hypothetical protein TIFTF001_014888 [Ficus carica]
MAGGRVYSGAGGSSTLRVLLQNKRTEPLDSLFFSGSCNSSSPPPSFLGSRSMMSFEDVHGGNGSNKSFFRSFGVGDDVLDDDLDEYFHQPGKKRRLTVEQVQFLEKSFEVENKLEPDRKVQLAKDLGLQPRQVAIWFQNRRARWKTKQMEKDYDVLQASYNSLKADYESMRKETDKLKTEDVNWMINRSISGLKDLKFGCENPGCRRFLDHFNMVQVLSEKLLDREKEKENLEVSENSNKLSQEPPEKPIADSEGEVSKVSAVEDISSVKSDIFDSDSPRFNDGVHSNSLLEPADSSYVFEADQSDLSQDEEDNLPSYIFPKLEDVHYSDPPASSCNFGFPEDHAFWSWSY